MIQRADFTQIGPFSLHRIHNPSLSCLWNVRYTAFFTTLNRAQNRFIRWARLCANTGTIARDYLSLSSVLMLIHPLRSRLTFICNVYPKRVTLQTGIRFQETHLRYKYFFRLDFFIPELPRILRNRSAMSFPRHIARQLGHANRRKLGRPLQYHCWWPPLLRGCSKHLFPVQ